jgi:PAS domain S-box-containing protein
MRATNCQLFSGKRSQGVAIVDNQLRVVFANEALLRLGQYERAEIQGHTPDAIFPAKDVPYIVQQHESGHHYRHNRNEFYLPRKDGAKIPAIFSGRVIKGPDGREYVILILGANQLEKHGFLCSCRFFEDSAGQYHLLRHSSQRTLGKLSSCARSTRRVLINNGFLIPNDGSLDRCSKSSKSSPNCSMRLAFIYVTLP